MPRAPRRFTKSFFLRPLSRAASTPELFIYINDSPVKHFPNLLYQTRYRYICFACFPPRSRTLHHSLCRAEKPRFATARGDALRRLRGCSPAAAGIATMNATEHDFARASAPVASRFATLAFGFPFLSLPITLSLRQTDGARFCLVQKVNLGSHQNAADCSACSRTISRTQCATLFHSKDALFERCIVRKTH